jgi:hypothetical protein
MLLVHRVALKSWLGNIHDMLFSTKSGLNTKHDSVLTKALKHLQLNQLESTSVVVALLLTEPEAPSTNKGRAAIVADQENAIAVDICRFWRTRWASTAVALTESLLPSDAVATVTPVTSPCLVPSSRARLRRAERRSSAPESRAARVLNAFTVDFVSGRAAMPITTVIGSRLVGAGGAFSVTKRCSAVPAR